MAHEQERRAAREAFARAEELDRDLLGRRPRAWAEMDRMRGERGRAADWPDWCLLPMAAATAVATNFAPVETLRPSMDMADIAQLSALYAWRHSRSVYLFEPTLAGRLAGTVPDLPDLGLLAAMPDWCVLIALQDPEWPGAGVWVHLEHDVNTGRPELRLLLDMVTEPPIPIPVYLDRGSVTEAVADYAATASGGTTPDGRVLTGRDVRGGDLNADAARLAERVDVWIALLSYLCRPEADIRELGRPGVRPSGRARSRRDGRTTWLVGYGG